MLRDRFDRIINYLRISITDRCNLRCRYCTDRDFPFIPHDEILTYEEIIRFVRISAALGVKKVRLTGGEPLSRRNLPYLISQIWDTAGIEDISLTTNGVFLPDRIDELREAGLTRVNISLDSLKSDRFAYITGSDVFDRVMEGIEKAKHAGLDPVKINTVIIKGFNDDEVLDFARFANAWEVEVRFIEFMPFSQTSLWDASKVMTSAALMQIIREVYELAPYRNAHKGPAAVFTMKGGPGKIGFISPMSSHICKDCNRIRLTSDGKLKPCLFSDQEYDVKHLLRGEASDDEIAHFVAETVQAKPERKFEGGMIKKCQRPMRNIGG
jgi:cyclic pyranopterin phosphate synthase